MMRGHVLLPDEIGYVFLSSTSSFLTREEFVRFSWILTGIGSRRERVRRHIFDLVQIDPEDRRNLIKGILME